MATLPLDLILSYRLLEAFQLLLRLQASKLVVIEISSHPVVYVLELLLGWLTHCELLVGQKHFLEILSVSLYCPTDVLKFGLLGIQGVP